MFGHMGIAETIYGGVVEPSYKKLLEQMLNILVTEVQRREETTRQRATIV